MSGPFSPSIFSFMAFPSSPRHAIWMIRKSTGGNEAHFSPEAERRAKAAIPYSDEFASLRHTYDQAEPGAAVPAPLLRKLVDVPS
jgi:hypothetical protein